MSRPGSSLRRCAGFLLLFVCLQAVGQFETPDSALRRGDTALGQGRFDVAQSIYQGALSSNPDLNLSSWRCRNIADAYIRATHPNLKVGAGWLQRAVEQDPNDLSLRQRLGTVLLQIGEFDQAATEFRYLIGKWPDYPPYVLGLASALRNSGKYDEGARLLLNALDREPNDPDMRIEYARTLLYQGKYGEAAEQYQQVLRWYPKDIDARIGLGKTYSWAGNQQQALEQYQKVLVTDPDNYDALVAQGFSLIWSERDNEALPMLERANSRHPEVAPVHDALKRLHAVNIFSGNVSAGGPLWPIQPPPSLMARISEKGRNTTTAWNPPPPQAANAFPEISVRNLPASAPPPMSQPRRSSSILWTIGVGLTILLSVFVLAVFILFSKPATPHKNEGKTASRPAESYTEHSLAEQWARLQEYSRTTAESLEPPRRVQPKIPAAAAVTWQTAKATQAENSIVATASGSNQVEPGYRENEAWRESDVFAHRPRRRRRGAPGPPERPWWRDTSNPDSMESAGEEEREITEACAAYPASTTQPPSFLDLPQEVEAPAAATTPPKPAAAEPPPTEEPPSRRSFVEVLSRAMERFSDGQVQESPEPVQPEVAEEEERAAESNRTTPETPTPEPVLSSELADTNIVIAGSGVMVPHYRAIFKAAGADIRTFTFWDLALSSMRKRRTDVLLIDGDALDGLSPAQMYESAKLEHYMFRSVLVAVNSDEDRTTLPQSVVLAHSLTDEDVRRRVLESLQA